MSPQHLFNAEQSVSRAHSAGVRMQSSEPFLIGLANAENILSEARHFAQGVAERKAVTTEAAARMLAAILGFEVSVHSVGAGLNALEGYARLPGVGEPVKA